MAIKPAMHGRDHCPMTGSDPIPLDCFPTTAAGDVQWASLFTELNGNPFATIVNSGQLFGIFRAGVAQFRTNDTTRYSMTSWTTNPETWDAWTLEILLSGYYDVKAQVFQSGGTAVDGEVAIAVEEDGGVNPGQPYSWPDDVINGGGPDRQAWSNNENVGVATGNAGMPTLTWSRRVRRQSGVPMRLTIFVERTGGTTGTLPLRAGIEARYLSVDTGFTVTTG